MGTLYIEVKIRGKIKIQDKKNATKLLSGAYVGWAVIHTGFYVLVCFGQSHNKEMESILMGESGLGSLWGKLDTASCEVLKAMALLLSLLSRIDAK